MDQMTPTFPPLLTGHMAKAGERPFETALSKVQAKEFSAGDLIWADDKKRLDFALVMEPDVQRERCQEILFVSQVALGDALGALVPPEVSVKYQWPNSVLMNDGKIGSIDMCIAEQDIDGVPEWMVIGVDLQIMPDFADDNPGMNIDVTTIWDEGCGEITSVELLESVSRHMVAQIHCWKEDGFGPIHKVWLGRMFEKQNQVPVLGYEPIKSLDESGNALISVDGKMVSKSAIDALNDIARLQS